MRKLTCFCWIFLLFTFAKTFAGSIHSYQELATAMQAGQQFAIVVNFQECTGNPNFPIGYFIPNKMILVPASTLNPERIVTSDLHFTDHKGYPTYEYIKYTFNSDNSIVIYTVIYDSPTFQSLDSPHMIHCLFDKGVTVYTFTDSLINSFKNF